jgi:ABC-type branched-subunit amino acid transport system substrate-binding protein
MLSIASHRGILLGAALASALALTACASSSPGTPASGGGQASGSTPLSGAPIRIGIIAPVQDQSISIPDVHRAAEIAVMDINDHGGIHGRPLQLDFCDDQADAEVAAQCAQTLLVTDHDVMLVGEAAGAGGTTIYPVLARTDKINFGDYAVAPADATNPLSYPLVPSTFQLATFPAVLPQGSGTVAMIGYSGYQALYSQLIGPPAEAKGYKLDIITEPSTTADWTVAATQVKQANAKYVLVATAQDKAATVIDALAQSGTTAKVVLLSTAVTSTAIKEISSTKTQSIIAAAINTDPSTSALYAQYLSDVKQYGASVGLQDSVGEQVVNAYAAVILFAQVARHVSTVDSATIKSYLDKQTDFSTGGLTHPLDFAKAGSLAGFPRIFNTWNLPAQPTSAGGFAPTSTTWLQP